MSEGWTPLTLPVDGLPVYAMTKPGWSIAKYKIDGKWKYGLWRGKETKAVGYFDSFDKAKERADDH